MLRMSSTNYSFSANTFSKIVQNERERNVIINFKLYINGKHLCKNLCHVIGIIKVILPSHY